MRVLIIIAVALITVGSLTFFSKAHSETITIKKDKPQVGEALYDYEPAMCFKSYQTTSKAL
jgi:hypothetical protein